jgi:chromosome segregation ATPase
MIDETLQAHRTKLIDAVEVARKELSDLEGSKSSLLERLDAAKASLEEKQSAKSTAGTAAKEAKEATTAAEAALEEAKGLQAKAEANHPELEKEKAALDATYQEHFKAPMDANEGPHFSFLKPFISSLGLEDSLSSALPTSCSKDKDQRGGFDELVLTELGKAFLAKIAGLEKSIVDEVSRISEYKAGVASAEAVLEAKKLSEEAAKADLEASTTAQSEAEVEVSQASEAWTSFEPRVQEATDNYSMHDTQRVDFEEGPLKDFTTLREKEVAVPEELEAPALGA